MKKIIVTFTALISINAFADVINTTTNTAVTNNTSTTTNQSTTNNSLFTEKNQFVLFDRQVSIGFSTNKNYLYNGAKQLGNQYNYYTVLDVERLFDNNIWADLNASLILGTTWGKGSGIGNGTGMNSSSMPASQNPYIGGVNGSLGYALNFNAMPTFQVIPYITLGRNSNMSMSTIISNGYKSVTNDFFMTAGMGNRFEYMLNNNYVPVKFYFDQNFNYNWDLSKPKYASKQDNLSVNLLLGAKANVYKELQVGLAGFWTYTHQTAKAPMTTSSNNGGLTDNGLTSVYRLKYTVGGVITLGLTF